MTDLSSPMPPPQQAGPARRVFHSLITLAGWVVFIYWWWIVFHRVSRHEVRFTILFVAVSLAVIVLVTLAWAWHNLRIFKRRGARMHVREATSDFSRDGVGRTVAYPVGGLTPQSAPVVYVRFTDDGKSYEFAATMPPRSGPKPSSPRDIGKRGMR